MNSTLVSSIRAIIAVRMHFYLSIYVLVMMKSYVWIVRQDFYLMFIILKKASFYWIILIMIL